MFVSETDVPLGLLLESVELEMDTCMYLLVFCWNLSGWRMNVKRVSKWRLNLKTDVPLGLLYWAVSRFGLIGNGCGFFRSSSASVQVDG